MKTFKRLKNIINSNLNSALDKAEDPEKMINLMISELEETVFKLQKGLKTRKAEKKFLEKEIIDAHKSEERWLDRAKLAVEQNREDLAKEALNEQKDIKSRIKVDEERIKAIESILMSEEESLNSVSTKLREVKEKRAILVNRAVHAKEKSRVRATLKEADGEDILRRFNMMEAKIEEMEAEVNISNKSANLKSEFEQMELNKEIDEALEELKQSMKKKSEE